MISELEKDLARLIYKHSSITGREFQRAALKEFRIAALRIAEGYFEPSDIDDIKLSDLDSSCP